MSGLQILALTVFVLALFVIVASTIHFGGRIRLARIPMHWGTGGNPTWYAPRKIGLWWQFYLTLAICAWLIILTRFVDSGKVDPLWWILMFFSATGVATHFWHDNAVSKWAARQQNMNSA
ncbi:MAG: hypothetical protein V4661_10455 [Pseudomonadota bacterium]